MSRVSLSPIELNALNAKQLSLTITPTGDAEGTYYLTPSSTVGAFEVGDLSVLIEPKIGIPQLLSLACYAIDKVGLQREQFDFPDEYALPDVLALALASAARRAFTCGLLHGYRMKEEAAVHRARARPVRRANMAQVQHSLCPVEVQLRRVHRRHLGKPIGESGGVPARTDAASFSRKHART